MSDLSCGGEGYGKEAHGLRFCGLVGAWLRAEGAASTMVFARVDNGVDNGVG